MNFLSLLVEHWHTILGLAFIVAGLIVCIKTGANLSAGDGPHRRY